MTIDLTRVWCDDRCLVHLETAVTHARVDGYGTLFRLSAPGEWVFMLCGAVGVRRGEGIDPKTSTLLVGYVQTVVTTTSSPTCLECAAHYGTP